MRRTVRISALAALALVVALSVFLATRHPISDATSAPSPLLGQRAPALAGAQLGGGRFDLAAHRGHVVVVNFWSSWCAPCVAEGPELSTYAWRSRASVVVVGVVFNDALSSAAAFAHRLGSLYPSVIDPGGAIANRYGVTSPPVTFVIDRHGRVAVTLLGPTNAAQLARVVKRVNS